MRGMIARQLPGFNEGFAKLLMMLTEQVYPLALV